MPAELDEATELHSHQIKKGNHISAVPFKKIGGDLLFHKQVQYHRRCEA